MKYIANQDRYHTMKYNRCGRSGLKLPAISLGLWHNFGDITNFENQRNIVLKVFDKGVTHFDLANNYGPPAGAAEENFGRILKKDLMSYRDELIISTKAGYGMWPGPYGEWGSRKYILASLDQSLKKIGLNYVDIFYSHRPDLETPLEETMGALDSAVRQGKALYVGISNYNTEQSKEAISILKQMGTPCLIHQAKYSMFNRWIENGLKGVLEEEGVGLIAFQVLEQGLLTKKYITDIPSDSRASGPSVFLTKEDITKEKIDKITKLNNVAVKRGQTLAQMAISWAFVISNVTSVLIGVSRVEQFTENLKALENIQFTKEELSEINNILK